MGLTYFTIETLMRERAYRPLTGTTVLIGRQKVYAAPAELLPLLGEYEIDLQGMAADDIEIDRKTVNRLDAFADVDLITDRALFRLLGASRVVAVDLNDYEGAEIIHDLTKPLPAELRNFADFVYDGSTLDNIFDPAMVIRNFAEMLRPGGRLLTVNTYSNHYEPYAMLPPLWFLDYFVVNKFVDCKVYIRVASTPLNAFTIDLQALLDPARGVSAFSSPYPMATVVLAEKGDGSTSDLNPVQQHYRSNDDWTTYRAELRRMMAWPRPHIARSDGDIVLSDVQGGHMFMDTNFVARDPWTEIHRRRSPIDSP